MPKAMPKKSFFVSLIVLVGFYFVVGALERGPVVVAARTLGALPRTIAGYRSEDFSFEDRVMKELAPDDTVSRRFFPASGGVPIVLYAGYYGTAKGGRTGHNPYACYPGAGWGITEDERVQVPFAGRGVAINQIVVKRGGEREVVLFWYQSQRDHVVAKGLQQNLNRFWNRVANGRDDGAFVRLSADVVGDDAGPVKEQIQRFAAALMPQLAAHWPVEKEADR